MTHFNPNHSLRLLIAASLAFASAVFLQIPNPYWAVMPVWILVQTSRDEVLEKGLWRLVGTLIGVLLSVGLSFFVEPIWLKLVLISLTLGLTSGISHAFRGFNGYGIQMLGITLGAVLIPTIHDSTHIVEFAQARFFCTIIGVVAVSVITYKFLPKSPIDQLLKDVNRFHTELAQSKYPTVPKISALLELKQRSHSLITLFHSAEIRKAFDQYFEQSLDHLLGRQQALPALVSIHKPIKRGFHLSTHSYHQLAFGTGLMIAALGFVGGMIGLYSGWKYGNLLAMGFCVLSAVLGGMTIPKKLAPHMLAGVLMGALTAVLYRIYLQPHLVSPVMKIIGTVPIFAFGAYLRTHERFRLASVDFNMIFLLVSQAGLQSSAQPRDVIESSVPILIAGLVVTSLYLYIPRPYARYAKIQEQKFLRSDQTAELFDALMLWKLEGKLESKLNQWINVEQFVSKRREGDPESK